MNTVTSLKALVKEYASDLSKEDQDFCNELILWALTVENKLDKAESANFSKFAVAGIAPYLGGRN